MDYASAACDCGCSWRGAGAANLNRSVNQSLCKGPPQQRCRGTFLGIVCFGYDFRRVWLTRGCGQR